MLVLHAHQRRLARQMRGVRRVATLKPSARRVGDDSFRARKRRGSRRGGGYGAPGPGCEHVVCTGVLYGVRKFAKSFQSINEISLRFPCPLTVSRSFWRLQKSQSRDCSAKYLAKIEPRSAAALAAQRTVERGVFIGTGPRARRARGRYHSMQRLPRGGAPSRWCAPLNAPPEPADGGWPEPAPAYRHAAWLARGRRLRTPHAASSRRNTPAGLRRPPRVRFPPGACTGTSP